MEIGLVPTTLIVFDGDPAPPLPKKGHSPQFSAHVAVVAKRLVGSRCTLMVRRYRPRHRRHLYVLDVTHLSLKRGEAAAPTRSMYCGQTAGWIKMVLGTNVGVVPGGIVSDEDPKRGTALQFSAQCLLAKWLD